MGEPLLRPPANAYTALGIEDVRSKASAGTTFNITKRFHGTRDPAFVLAIMPVRRTPCGCYRNSAS